MKRTLLLFAFATFSVSTFAQQDTITNAGFERWTAAATYDDPDGWTTLNPAGVFLGAELAFQATDAEEIHSGSSAVKLVTAEVEFFGMTPSILTTGEINTTTQEVEGGWPMNSRPTSFGGWFRYDTLMADTGLISITLSKMNSSSGMSEIIGYAEYDVLATDSMFQNIELTIDYTSSEVPDEVLILMGSGGNNAQSGSTLFVDDLYYTFATGIKSPLSVGLGLYPNPTDNVLNISSSKGIEFTNATVYTIDGRAVLNTTLLSGLASVDVSNLYAGTYIVELGTVDGAVVRERFLKK